MNKNALVVSGGGNKGAWGGGLVQYLKEVQHKEWDIYVGTSTGSLLINLIALDEMERLKHFYTKINNSNIFSVDPFTKNGNFNILNAIWRVIRSKTSLGEAGNLRKRIKEGFSESDYAKLVEVKDLYACVTNYTRGRIEYGHNKKLDYSTYIEFVMASTAVPIICDLVKIGNYEYLDGGVMEHVPIQKAIDSGATEIDVVILRPEHYDKDNWTSDNMWRVLNRTIDLLERQVSMSNVQIGKLEAKEHDVKINFYYTPYKLTDNSMIFDEQQMLKWWEAGYAYLQVHQAKSILLKK